MADDSHTASSHDSSGATAPDTTELNGSACNGQVNPGFEDTESLPPPPPPPAAATPTQNGGGGGDFKSPGGGGDPVAEAVNLELVNMSPYSNSIPVKKESTELDMNDPYDEYFVPVNQHKKYIRGEKLYVTQDKRENLAGSKKKCCCGVVTVLVLGAIIAILVGVILTQDTMTESEARNYNKAGFDVNLIQKGTPRPTTIPPPQTSEMSHMYLKNVLEGELTIDNMEFTPGLSDSNSSEFQTLATSLEEEIKSALFDHQTLHYGPATILLKVLGFRRGSVVVLYRVGWTFKEGIHGAPDPINMETIKVKLQKHIRENDGFLYNYRVPSHSIKADRITNNCLIENGGCSNECIYDPTLLQTLCSCPPGYILDIDGKTCTIESEHIHHETEYQLPDHHHHEETGSPDHDHHGESESPDQHHHEVSESPVHQHSEETFEQSTEKPDEPTVKPDTLIIPSTHLPPMNTSESIYNVPEESTEIVHEEQTPAPIATSSHSDGIIEHELKPFTEGPKELETSSEMSSENISHEMESSPKSDEHMEPPQSTEGPIVMEPVEVVPSTESHEVKVDPSMNPPMEFLPEYSTYPEGNDGFEVTTSGSIIQSDGLNDFDVAEKKVESEIPTSQVETSTEKMADEIKIANDTVLPVASEDNMKNIEINLDKSTESVMDTKTDDTDVLNVPTNSNETDSLNNWSHSSEFGSGEANTNYSEVMNHLLSGDTHMSQEVMPVEDKSNETLNYFEITGSSSERPLEFNAIETFREAKSANLTNSTSQENEEGSDNSTIIVTEQQNETLDGVPMVNLTSSITPVEESEGSTEEKPREIPVKEDIIDDTKMEDYIKTAVEEQTVMENGQNMYTPAPLAESEPTTSHENKEEEITLFITPPPDFKTAIEESNSTTNDSPATEVPTIDDYDPYVMNSKIEEKKVLAADNIAKTSMQANESTEIMTEQYSFENTPVSVDTEIPDLSESSLSKEITTQAGNLNISSIDNEKLTETEEGKLQSQEKTLNSEIFTESSEGITEDSDKTSINMEEEHIDKGTNLEINGTIPGSSDSVSGSFEKMSENNDTKSEESGIKQLSRKSSLSSVNIDELLKESSNSLNSLDDDYERSAIKEKYKSNKSKLIKNFDVKEIFGSDKNASDKLTEVDAKHVIHLNHSEIEEPIQTELTTHSLLSNEGYVTESPLFTTKKDGIMVAQEKAETSPVTQDPKKNPLLVSDEAYSTESPLFTSKSPTSEMMEPTDKTTSTTPLIIDLLEENKQRDSDYMDSMSVESLNKSSSVDSTQLNHTVEDSMMISHLEEGESTTDVNEFTLHENVTEEMEGPKDIPQSEIILGSTSESIEKDLEPPTTVKEETLQVKEMSSENKTMILERNQNQTSTELMDSVVKLVLNGSYPNSTSYSKCPSGQVPCKDNSGCIAPNQLCDSENDCKDGSDEAECKENNCLHNFQCTDGTCLKRHLVCDSNKHCSDGSDELNCENWKCNFDEVPCYPSSRQCIPALWKCDGVPHCPQKEDEIGCKDSCENHEFLCPEGFCIPAIKKCDGQWDCIKGADELNCSR